MKSPIGFVKSYPKMILKPSDVKQYEGGDLILVAQGFYIPLSEPDEEEDATDSHPQ